MWVNLEVGRICHVARRRSPGEKIARVLCGQRAGQAQEIDGRADAQCFECLRLQRIIQQAEVSPGADLLEKHEFILTNAYLRPAVARRVLHGIWWSEEGEAKQRALCGIAMRYAGASEFDSSCIECVAIASRFRPPPPAAPRSEENPDSKEGTVVRSSARRGCSLRKDFDRTTIVGVLHAKHRDDSRALTLCGLSAKAGGDEAHRVVCRECVRLARGAGRASGESAWEPKAATKHQRQRPNTAFWNRTRR